MKHKIIQIKKNHQYLKYSRNRNFIKVQKNSLRIQIHQDSIFLNFGRKIFRMNSFTNQLVDTERIEQLEKSEDFSKKKIYGSFEDNQNSSRISGWYFGRPTFQHLHVFPEEIIRSTIQGKMRLWRTL